jgi:hypothetical protein
LYTPKDHNTTKTFSAHRVLSSKATLIMPPRQTNQRLHPAEGLLQTSAQNNPPLPPPKLFPPSPKAQNAQPSTTFSKFSYINQPTCPPLQRAPARTTEAPLPPKPTEVIYINRSQEYHHQYRSSKTTSSLIKFMCKTRTKRTKPQRTT